MPLSNKLLYHQFRLCITALQATRASGKSHTPMVACILRLPCVKGGFSLTPLYHKSAEKTSSLPIFMCHGPSRTPVPTNCNIPYEKEPKRSFFLCYPNNFEPLYFIWLKTAPFFYLYGDRYIHRHRIPAKRSHHLYSV